jgi:hypothetical protein
METKKTATRLDFRCIIGTSFLALGIQDLLAWAQLTSAEAGWLIRLTGADWLQPIGGLLLVTIGILLLGPACMSVFSIRDAVRKQARRATLLAGLIAGIALLLTVESLLPSKDVLPVVGKGVALTKASRQIALLGLVISFSAIASFNLLRRRDVGFFKLSLPIERTNEIWRLIIKVEVAIRALPKNEEACLLAEQRLDFIQARVGGQFDRLCESLIKESADLSTIDNTARLQMDVGHVFKRYADFHRRLADTRHSLCEDLMKATYDGVVDLLERDLPGQSLRIGVADGVKVSISHPVLSDTMALQRRRSEWDETLRTIVSSGAEKGNQIVGDWIQRAAKGEVSAEEVPAAVEALRALCQHSARQENGFKPGSNLLELGV